MIEEYFGFSTSPFRLSPDAKFFFSSAGHTKAMAHLHYGLRQGEGFIVITGEIGTGKSMLIDHLFDQIDPATIVAAHMVTSSVKADALLDHVLSCFGVEAAETGPSAALNAFEDFLTEAYRGGQRVLLVVDEAQNLPLDTLEELRMLSNLTLEGEPVFQVFLVGQPEFRSVLARPDLEQLRQRVIASYHLQPLNSEETRDYIDHRLMIAGRVQRPLFTEEAFDRIFSATNGVPRRINTLCTRLLLFCALEKRDLINSAVVETVLEELKGEGQPFAGASSAQERPVLEPGPPPVVTRPNGHMVPADHGDEKPEVSDEASLDDVALALRALTMSADSVSGVPATIMGPADADAVSDGGRDRQEDDESALETAPGETLADDVGDRSPDAAESVFDRIDAVRKALSKTRQHVDDARRVHLTRRDRVRVSLAQMSQRLARAEELVSTLNQSR